MDQVDGIGFWNKVEPDSGSGPSQPVTVAKFLQLKNTFMELIRAALIHF